MKIVFVYDEDGVTNVTPASVRMIDDLPPAMAADIWQDILMDAQREYDRARVRCGWEPMFTDPAA